MIVVGCMGVNSIVLSILGKMNYCIDLSLHQYDDIRIFDCVMAPEVTGINEIMDNFFRRIILDILAYLSANIKVREHVGYATKM